MTPATEMEKGAPFQWRRWPETESLVDSLLEEITADVRATIARHAEGNPFYAEESARLVRDKVGQPEAPGAVVRPAAAYVIRAQLDPKVVDLAFKAPVGAVQGPVEASVGWAVFKVLERHVGDEAGFQILHILSTAGASILAAGFFLPSVYLVWALFYGRKAGPNPWHATGLEWTTQSPPSPHNFEVQPVVTEGAYEYSKREIKVV